MRLNPDGTAGAGRSPGSLRLRHTLAALTGTVLVFTAACGPYRSHSAVTGPASRAEDRVASVLQAVWAGVESGDPGPVLATFTDDVQLHSPALMGPEYRGRELVASIVTPAMQILGSARVTDVLRAGDGSTGSVVFETRIGNEPAQGCCPGRDPGWADQRDHPAPPPPCRPARLRHPHGRAGRQASARRGPGLTSSPRHDGRQLSRDIQAGSVGAGRARPS